MYGVFFLFKNDSRKLLLDYARLENPLLKDFSSDGIKDIFYNLILFDREICEMYCVFFLFKNDSRKLLLYYARFDNSLLKDFSSDCIQDIFYNFFENQVMLSKSEVIEV